MRQLVLQKGTFIVAPLPENLNTYGLGTAIMTKHGHGHYVAYNTISDLYDQRIKLPFSKKPKPFELIGLVSDILKDEELSKKVVDECEWFFTHISAFQSLCTKYELKPTDLLIKKL